MRIQRTSVSTKKILRSPLLPILFDDKYVLLFLNMQVFAKYFILDTFEWIQLYSCEVCEEGNGIVSGKE